MQLVADESVDGQLVAALRKTGHSVIYIAESLPSIKDPDVLQFAASRQEILLTEDKDFGELVHLKRMAHAGVILLRLNDMSARDMIARVIMLLDHHGDGFADAFTTIDRNKVRIRRTT
jgi:predicted nuclease of predicted toxin-antitoxin system